MRVRSPSWAHPAGSVQYEHKYGHLFRSLVLFLYTAIPSISPLCMHVYASYTPPSFVGHPIITASRQGTILP